MRARRPCDSFAAAEPAPAPVAAAIAIALSALRTATSSSSAVVSGAPNSNTPGDVCRLIGTAPQ